MTSGHDSEKHCTLTSMRNQNVAYVRDEHHSEAYSGFQRFWNKNALPRSERAPSLEAGRRCLCCPNGINDPLRRRWVVLIFSPQR